MAYYNETIRVVREVGKELLDRMQDNLPQVHEKDHSHQNLVTDFDVWVQTRLIEKLSHVVPVASFFAEEKENQRIDGLTWIVDPIDGTTNFISTRQNFSLSVALYDGITPIFGVVYAPAEDLCYHARWGKEAY